MSFRTHRADVNDGTSSLRIWFMYMSFRTYRADVNDGTSSLRIWFMYMSFTTYRRDVHPFETDTKGRLFGVDVSVNWLSHRDWQTKVLDSWKATQLTLLRQKVLIVII